MDKMSNRLDRIEGNNVNGAPASRYEKQCGSGVADFEGRVNEYKNVLETGSGRKAPVRRMKASAESPVDWNRQVSEEGAILTPRGAGVSVPILGSIQPGNMFDGEAVIDADGVGQETHLLRSPDRAGGELEASPPLPFSSSPPPNNPG